MRGSVSATWHFAASRPTFISDPGATLYVPAAPLSTAREAVGAGAPYASGTAAPGAAIVCPYAAGPAGAPYVNAGAGAAAAGDANGPGAPKGGGAAAGAGAGAP